MTLARHYGQDHAVRECWGCGNLDASHTSAAERDECRDHVARGIVALARLHRANVVGCGCDSCAIVKAAHRNAQIAPHEIYLP